MWGSINVLIYHKKNTIIFNILRQYSTLSILPGVIWFIFHLDTLVVDLCIVMKITSGKYLAKKRLIHVV